MWAKLTADPETRMYLQQPDFVKMMQEMQKNPNNLNLYLKDQRVMRAFGDIKRRNLRRLLSIIQRRWSLMTRIFRI
ncbi:hypothetical protein OIU84_004189 [Salix udensis]|uniref:STI1 domain-containing protein n=1 Tax=Salix udensis TaxID=889485 RepID=A0AAD6P3G9_9ROSI|nr:hypothetical protein OIU84_004189 [Salix udensis]